LAVVIAFTFIVVRADETPERQYRSFKVFGNSIDKLLLETPHVYVKASNETESFYINNFGLIYYANISITMSAGLPKIVDQWSQWFSGSSVVINKDKNGKASVSIKTDGESDKESDSEESKAQKYKDLEEADAERLKNMEDSLESFKREVMELTLDFASIIKVHNRNDTLSLVFMVAEPQFLDRFGTNSLQMQIRFKDLDNLAGKSLGDSEVRKAFQWNI